VSGVTEGLLGRVMRHQWMARPRAVARRGLDALAARIASRLPTPVAPEMPPPAADEQCDALARRIVSLLPPPPEPAADEQCDALARRIVSLLPPPPEPAADERVVNISQHILGQQQMLLYHSLDRLDRSLLLQGRIAAMQIATRQRVGSLADVEFRVSSQWGEDGIIEWLCQKIPDISRSFVEFGVENFSEANTRFLIENRGWRGLVMDGNDEHMRYLRGLALHWRHDLTAVAAFITAENINALITGHGFAGELGILSVDIDGNDYWVLDAIDCVNPAILICEINGVFGDLRPITVPSRPDFQRMEGHYSGQYFGCSVAAVRMLCERRGYRFIGTNSTGVNAFFVRNDVAGPVLDALEDVRVWPPRHRDSRDIDGQMDFARGIQRRDLIVDLPVVDLRSGELVALHDMYPLYSDRFFEDFR
jgi:hypothetical protein